MPSFTSKVIEVSAGGRLWDVRLGACGLGYAAALDGDELEDLGTIVGYSPRYRIHYRDLYGQRVTNDSRRFKNMAAAAKKLVEIHLAKQLPRPAYENATQTNRA